MALELTVQGLAAIAALAEARAAEKAAEKAAKEAAATVKALLGDEREGTIAGVVVVELKEIVRHGVDATALKAKYPEIADEVDKVTTYDKIVLA
jgi:predicted phage-related endonuclease